MTILRQGARPKNTFVNNWVQYESSLERVDFYGRGGETTRLTTWLKDGR